MHLALQGANVIKIEPLGGDINRRSRQKVSETGEFSALFISTNRAKRSIAVDLKKPEAVRIVRDLAARSDVLVQNFRPGAMERLGLGWDAGSTLNPRLIYASASGYGESSPYRDRPGQDLLMQAFSGLASISGRAGQPPIPVGTAVIDQHGAALLAMGVLAALLERARTGKGLRVEGNLTVRKRLFIRATGRVSGTIRYGQIEIERGGQISGDIQSGDELAADAPGARVAF